MPLVHLDDDPVEAAPRRVLKPGPREEPEPTPARLREPGQYLYVQRYRGEPPADLDVLKCWKKVERLIEEKASTAAVEAAQRELADAREAAEENERLQVEREMVGRAVQRRAANDARLKAARAGAAAAAKMRRQDAYVLVTSFHGVVIRAFPSRADDVVIRQTVIRSFSEAASWFSMLAEKEIAAARIKAMNGSDVALWQPAAICARLKEDLAVGLRNNCISISVGRES